MSQVDEMYGLRLVKVPRQQLPEGKEYDPRPLRH
jgi:hypothetical protein